MGFEMAERLTGIVGSMFSGKTSELLRLIERTKYAGRTVLPFKPNIDTRYENRDISSHSGGKCKAISIDIHKPEKIERAVRLYTAITGKKPSMVVIDEIQFFDTGIEPVIENVLENSEVVYAGLPTDFRNEVFGSMGTLMPKSDKITRLSAICRYQENGEICGEDATRTQRLVNGLPAKYDDPIIMVGAAERYEARCSEHHKCEK